MRIGITGHQSLEKRLSAQGARHSESVAWDWVERAFDDFLVDTASSEAVVVSSLAGGADQRLSRVAQAHGARVEVVIPSAKYFQTFRNDADRNEYERLLHQAVKVVQLHYPEPSEDAYFAAGKCVVDHSDTIVAVWDGQEAEGFGGTSDIVAHALNHGRIVLHLDPIRRTVETLR